MSPKNIRLEKEFVLRIIITVVIATSAHMVRNHVCHNSYYVIVTGEPHICQNLNQFGHGKGTLYGGCSEYTIVPAKYAYLLQTDLDDAKAAILERMYCYFYSIMPIVA